MLKPEKLRVGDKVATVSLSWGGPGAFPQRYEVGKRQLSEVFSLEVVEAKNALRSPDWLYRHPEARAADLMDSFSDQTIKAIVSTIGGEDSIRILRFLDIEVIRSNPKIFIGYSDTTVAHFACFKAGLVSFYGPSVMSGFGENCGPFPYMVDSVKRTMFSADPIGEIRPSTEWTDEHLDWKDPDNQLVPRTMLPNNGWCFLQGSGIVEGLLLGGCFEVVEWMRWTPVWPELSSWKGAVLFLETSEEGAAPEAVTRILRAFAAQGILSRLSGILFGRPGGGINEEDFYKYDTAIMKVLTEEGLESLPVVTRLDFGHTDPMFILPYGVKIQIDCESQRLAIVEEAVKVVS